MLLKAALLLLGSSASMTGELSSMSFCSLEHVPIVPFMPHSPRDLGIFDQQEDGLPDTLNRFEHWWMVPVQFILPLFGFANAGVPFERIGPGTYYVLAG